MGGKSWDEWVEEYSLSHQNRINQITHSIGIPMIVISLVAAVVGLFMNLTVPLYISVALFLTGWILQFIGHYFEGKPPEFLKDYRFLFVGVRWWFKKNIG
ncbi:MAG: Mpo1-like protein [Acidobacteriota bacterium]